MKKFPKGFYWGAATASYQVEGGIENTDWAQAAREGKVPVAGRSSDHYNRYEEDFDRAKNLGHNAHRFSIEWARVEPEEGVFDQHEIEHYRMVLRALKKRGMTPFVTLWHFTQPLWFAESGGFLRADAPEIFARYCARAARELGGECAHFSTMNEPNVWASHGWIYGAWPPFKRAKLLWKKIGKEDGTSEQTGAVARFAHFFDYFKVERNLATAHIRAYEEIKKVAPQSNVSVVKHVHVFKANRSPMHKARAAIMQYLQTYQFMNALKGKYDEIGLNYYQATTFGERKNYMKTDMGWDVRPSDIYGALMKLKRYKKPIFIAEAGVADANDSLRADYIRAQVRATWQAIQDGADVRGHLYWSLLDNYEWALGYEKRFGLVEIDYETLKRTVRPSAYVYKEICENNAMIE